jgi:hypothetical protein
MKATTTASRQPEMLGQQPGADAERSAYRSCGRSGYRPLNRIVAANNKVPTSQVDLSYQMVRIGGSWYVRNDNVDIGPDAGDGSSGSPVATAAP